MQVQEFRRLVFAKSTLAGVFRTILPILAPGLLPAGDLSEVVLNADTAPWIIARVRQPGHGGTIDAEISPEVAAAVLINLLRASRVPMPRDANKSLVVEADAVCLEIRKLLPIMLPARAMSVTAPAAARG